MKIFAHEFSLPIREGLQCHASHFTILDDGRIFCVCFYGTKESHDDVRIFGTFRETDGTWSEPFPISEDDGIAHWNPVLFQRNDGTHMLFYKIGKKIPYWKTYCRISKDNCKTWSDSFELVSGDETGGRGPVRNKAIYLSDGSILAPASTEQGEWRCFFDRSTDNGKTWTRTDYLSIQKDMQGKYESLDGHGIIQPTVWQSEDGFHALMRSTEGWIYRTDSIDTIHWCEPYKTSVPNNNKGIDLAQTPDGRLFLVCTPIGIDNVRTPLSLLVSSDNGKSFSLYSQLETTATGKFLYPAVRYADGCLHITYTWNYKMIAYLCLGDL